MLFFQLGPSTSATNNQQDMELTGKRIRFAAFCYSIRGIEINSHCWNSIAILEVCSIEISIVFVLGCTESNPTTLPTTIDCFSSTSNRLAITATTTNDLNGKFFRIERKICRIGIQNFLVLFQKLFI